MRPAILALPPKRAPVTSPKPPEGFPLAWCCAQSAARSSSSMLAVMASVPRPTSTPRRTISTTSAMPTALLRFDCGLCTTAVPVSASRRSRAARRGRSGRRSSACRGSRGGSAGRSPRPRRCGGRAAGRPSPRRRGCGSRPRARARGSAASSSVRSESVNEACRPKSARRPGPPWAWQRRMKWTFSARPSCAALGAVAVGDLVAEAGAKARLAHGARDRVERAAHGAGARVVVDEGRRAVADRVDERHEGALVAVLGGERGVQPPPQVAQDAHEVPGRPGLREAPGERAVEVGVGVDEAGHDDLARGVERSPLYPANSAPGATLVMKPSSMRTEWPAPDRGRPPVERRVPFSMRRAGVHGRPFSPRRTRRPRPATAARIASAPEKHFWAQSEHPTQSAASNSRQPPAVERHGLVGAAGAVAAVRAEGAGHAPGSASSAGSDAKSAIGSGQGRAHELVHRPQAALLQEVAQARVELADVARGRTS